MEGLTPIQEKKFVLKLNTLLIGVVLPVRLSNVKMSLVHTFLIKPLTPLLEEVQNLEIVQQEKDFFLRDY